MKFNYGQEVLILPGATLTAAGKADAETLRVLLWLASDATLAEKPGHLAKLAECSEEKARKAISGWVSAGILGDERAREERSPKTKKSQPNEEAGEKKQTESEKSRKIFGRVEALPNYTSTELSDYLEQREEVRLLGNEAQNILGKVFNAAEWSILVGLLDYVGMEPDCVLLLLQHCKRIGKTNLRSIEKYALTLAEEEITSAEALEERIRAYEAFLAFEGEVRRLFGMKARALTSKEQKCLEKWISFGYGAGIVQLAYEITVNATNEPSVAYANAILEKWNAEGLKTEEQIRAMLDSEKQKRNMRNLAGGSAGDDYFEAAIRRTMAEYEDSKQEK